MMHNSDMLAAAKKILHRQAGLRDYQIMHPARDWLIGVGIALLIFVCGAIISIQLYVSNSAVAENLTEETEEVVVYRESIVEAALTQLRSRETVFLSILGSTPTAAPVVATSTPTVEEVLESDLDTESNSTTSAQTPLVPASDEVLPAPL